MSSSVQEGQGLVDPALVHPFELDRLADKVHEEKLVVSEEGRSVLKTRFDLVSLDALTADLRLRRLSRGRIVRLEGRLQAELSQSCVVTLQPVAAKLDEEFTLDFAKGPVETDRLDEGALIIDPLAEEVPDELPDNGVLDLGEIVAEQLALMLDPYPRAESATLVRSVFGAKEEDEADEKVDKSSPFAVLKSLKAEND